MLFRWSRIDQSFSSGWILDSSHFTMKLDDKEAAALK